MKIIIMSGALKNAGDFLIVERCRKLILHKYPEAVIFELNRYASLKEHIDEVNSFDIMVFAGGPGYFSDFYPKGAPLVDNLDEITIPIIFMGMGWFGRTADCAHLYSYSIEGKTKELLERSINDTGYLGCRDYLSVIALRNSGLDKAVMTGCPAWYDVDYLMQKYYNGVPMSGVKRICISDPAKPENIMSAVKLVQYLRSAFPGVKLECAFHRGHNADQYTSEELASVQNRLWEILARNGVECHDISYGAEGFRIYDECDLHIGFRVHAHIYNLSHRKLSILIEEDGRGGGVNQALGLPQVCAYQLKGEHYAVNPWLIEQVEDLIMNMALNHYILMNNAYSAMYEYYKQMDQQLESIQTIIDGRGSK